MCNKSGNFKFHTCSVAQEDNRLKQSWPAIEREYIKKRKKGTSCISLTCQAPVDPISVWSISPPVYQGASIILVSVFHC